MKLLDISRKYGSVTYKYPFEPYAVNKGFRGRPIYTYQNCLGCTACAIACPANAINVQLNPDKTKLVWEFNCARCIFCGRCDEVCPTSAVVLSNEFENAVLFNKDDLKVQGELDLQHCTSCNKPFTTKRLVNYAYNRLKAAGWDEETLNSKTACITTCPDCKKKQAVDSAVQGYFPRGATSE